MFLVSFAVVIAISCSMLCCGYKYCRGYPQNYILLATYTVFHSYLIGALCQNYNPEIVLAAAAVTAGMFLALTLYACFTKTDFTYMGGILCVSTFSLIMFFILMSWFTKKNSVAYLIIICCFIVLLSIWIIYDTQLIIGNKKKGYAEFSLDDYCIGALIIYSDIITLFLYIL